MAQAKLKTKETKVSVAKFIAAVPDKQKQEDSFTLIKLMQEHSGFEPKMWGPSIIGFGTYHYKYESGHEGDMPLIAFSPRKPSIVLYIGFDPAKKEDFLAKLGKHTASKACIYVKKLADIDMAVLKKMVVDSLKYMKKTYKLAC